MELLSLCAEKSVICFFGSMFSVVSFLVGVLFFWGGFLGSRVWVPLFFFWLSGLLSVFVVLCFGGVVIFLVLGLVLFFFCL